MENRVFDFVPTCGDCGLPVSIIKNDLGKHVEVDPTPVMVHTATGTAAVPARILHKSTCPERKLKKVVDAAKPKKAKKRSGRKGLPQADQPELPTGEPTPEG